MNRQLFRVALLCFLLTAALSRGVSAVTMGDVNGDGVIDQADVDLVAKAAIELVTLTDEQKLVADFNENGRIDVTDVAEISLLVGQLEESNNRTLPNTGIADYKAAYLCAFALSVVCAAGAYRIRKKNALRG